MAVPTCTRRAALRQGILGSLAATVAGAQRVDAFAQDTGFAYEVTRSDAEWRTLLTKEEFRILREGGTETPKSSPLWNEEGEGIYLCRGCGLTVYVSEWKTVLERGWVFFYHAVSDSVLTSVDGVGSRFDADGTDLATVSTIEVHCRRCGSHLGHIFNVNGHLLHCINGTSLTFVPKT